ncbi:MAG: ribonuclease VapC [Methanobacterium sp.]
MSDKVFVLDASAIIGGFSSKESQNFITASVISEIKDFKSKIYLESAIEDGSITIMEPESVDIKNVTEVIMKSGDILRLSDEDIGLVALAFKLKRNQKDPLVVTDDYSMQNVLKIVGIPYRSVITEGINEVYGWIKICKGCKKKYPPEYIFDECEICGTRIIKKRIKNS